METVSPIKIFIRTTIDVLIAVSVLEGWWFIALPLSAIGVWFFDSFVEIIVAGLAYDSLFGFVYGSGVIAYLGTIISVVAFVSLSFVKSRVRKARSLFYVFNN